MARDRAVDLARAASIVSGLCAAWRLRRVYDPAHPVVSRAIERTREALGSYADGRSGQVTIVARTRMLLVDDLPVNPPDAGPSVVAHLRREFARLGIGAIAIPFRVGADELLGLALLPRETGPIADLTECSLRLGLTGIRLEPPVAGEETDADEPSALEVYADGLRTAQRLLRSGDAHEPEALDAARRSVGRLARTVAREAEMVLALTQIRQVDRFLFEHCFRVCAYAVLLGERIGLERRQLSDLGMCALFHDLGLVDGAEPEVCPMERGAMRALGLAVGQIEFLSVAVTAWEHHRLLEEGETGADCEPHLYSRIVTIADSFDRLTAKHESDRIPYSPAEALWLMRCQCGALFHSTLFKAFVETIGIYPVGSWVRLDRRETALVIGVAPCEQIDRPTVRILQTAGRGSPVGTVLDLVEHSERSIVRGVSREERYLSVAEQIASLEYLLPADNLPTWH